MHLYGCPADLAPILEIARKEHLFVVEDCAQAHGAVYRGKKVGAWGNISAFSFYPTKNLGAYGDGGAIVTDDPALAKQVRLLRQYGWEMRQVSSIRGLNSRLDDLQAAILRVKLRYLDGWNKRRQELAGYYSMRLSGTSITLPLRPPSVAHVYHNYTINFAQRDSLRAFLAERGIQSLIHYPLPIHLQPAYKDLGYHPGDLPVSELTALRVLSLPLYPEMTNAAAEAVCGGIRGFLEKK